MTVPLIILAVFAVGVGLALGPTHLFAHFLEHTPGLPHGHDHRHALTFIDGPGDKKIPSLGVPSASPIAHGRSEPASYNLIRISNSDARWHCEVTVRGFTAHSHTIGEIGRRRLM